MVDKRRSDIGDRDTGNRKPETRNPLPIWFFIGVLLLIYGVIILVAGVNQFSHPPATVLSQLHATFWGGITLTAIGAFYTLAYRPRR
jgi:uncharacterized membrane protein